MTAPAPLGPGSLARAIAGLDRPPRILILGHGRHGKDTAAEILARLAGLRHVSSSEYCARVAVYPLVADLWPDWRAAYDARADHRALWFHAIAAYNLRPGPSLAAQILEDHAIYVGMRSRAEFARSRDLFDLVIWVDRSAAIAPEAASSNELGPQDADFILDNAGTLADLETRIRAALGL